MPDATRPPTAEATIVTGEIVRPGGGFQPGKRDLALAGFLARYSGTTRIDHHRTLRKFFRCNRNWWPSSTSDGGGRGAVPEITPPPPTPVTRALLRLLAAALVVMASLFVVLSAMYFRLDGRTDRQGQSVARQALAIDRQAAALQSVQRLATAFARLSSSDPAERQAARDELAQLAAEAAQAEVHRQQTTEPDRPPSTTASRSQPSATTTTTTAAAPAPSTSTTTTTRPCRALPIVGCVP